MPRQKKVSQYKAKTGVQISTLGGKGKQDHSISSKAVALTAKNVKLNFHPDSASEILKHMSSKNISKVDPKVAEKMDQEWAKNKLKSNKIPKQFKAIMEEPPNNAPVYSSKENRIRRSMESNPKLDLKPAEAEIDKDRYI